MRRVVITGFGILSPIGNNKDEIKSSFLNKKSGVIYMPEWEKIQGLKTKVAGMVKNFDEKALDRKARRSMGKVAMFSTICAKTAIEDANISDELLKSGRLGVATASTIGSPQAYEDFFYEIFRTNSIEQITSMTFLKIMNHTTAANIAVNFGITGRVFSPSSACTSSSQSIGMSYEAIKFGIQDVMLAGGAEEVHHTTAATFDILNVASKAHNDSPQNTPSPFDKNRDGIVVGEGGGIVVLEELEHAKKRGAKIYGEIVGFSSLSDGSHMSTPAKEGMANTMKEALKNAGLTPKDIDYINAHATATDTGDVAESEATKEIFGDTTPISATKSFTGHTLGACGVHELIYSLFMLEDNLIYPTINLNEIDPRCDGIKIVTEVTKKDLNFILTNNFAFGGINTSVVLKK
ncbi:MAG TPA: beta-ketoacyl-ACP synthase [Spirochaetota bacterium]|nr:beta-ketoacyl-ACP synthase [Spirochaetota bacterium]HOS33156.1 beta-ketoacyl-ACP synthase [Spirochaetota bacterium]HOS55336.1 beta-ketoacyl-ACP synthase [Spirochaetota bacterium]HQF76881.1 beta-ketoacyl-ACP synthase [Spirochaetota bacterium]HQH30754.1 beta-ketoacyl-ACP synthase [Spirochaetota bacterium]